jgi:hypothetical protein
MSAATRSTLITHGIRNDVRNPMHRSGNAAPSARMADAARFRRSLWASGAAVISLSDKQPTIVTDAAANLPVEKRALLLERIAARLRLIGRFNTHDVEAAARLAGHNLSFSKLAQDG